MQFCPKCKVSINGNKKCCPLCQGELSGESDGDVGAYPFIERPKYNKNALLRIVSFAAIVSIVVCISINLMVPARVWWSLFATGGIVCGWIATSVGIVYKRKLFKNITWQLFILTTLAVLWDWVTEWRGWSIDYVLPCTCLASMLSMVILSKVMKIPVREYIVYFVLDAVYGIVPIIFFLTGVLNVVYPSVICVAASIVSISALILFQGKNMKEEMARKMHV